MSEPLEFDCRECGMHIIDFSGQWREPVCAHCMWYPRWFNDPKLCEIFDRDNWRRLLCDVCGLHYS